MVINMNKKQFLTILIILSMMLTGCDMSVQTAGEAWSLPNPETSNNADRTVFKYLQGIESDPSDFKVVVGTAGTSTQINDIITKGAGLASVLGITGTDVVGVRDTEVTANEEFLIIMGLKEDTSNAGGLIASINTEAGIVPASLIDAMEAGTYDGIVYVIEDVPDASPANPNPTQLMILAYDSSKLELIINYLKVYTTHTTELADSVLIFKSGVPSPHIASVARVTTPPSPTTSDDIIVTVNINVEDKDVFETVLATETVESDCIITATTPVSLNTLQEYPTDTQDAGWLNIKSALTNRVSSSITYTIRCANTGTHDLSGYLTLLYLDQTEAIVTIPTTTFTVGAAPVSCTDLDSDGYCEEASAASCDIISMCTNGYNDCDDAVATGGSIYQLIGGYTDADGDTYGTDTETSPTQVCSGAALPSTHSTNNLDCNEVIAGGVGAAINPGVTEAGATMCADNLDNDCDDTCDKSTGSCSEAGVTAGDTGCPLVSCTDADGDGYCVEASAAACDVTSMCTNGYNDCNEVIAGGVGAAINPGVTEAGATMCADTLDNDCDDTCDMESGSCSEPGVSVGDTGCPSMFIYSDTAAMSLLTKIINGESGFTDFRGVVGDTADPSDSIGSIDVAGKFGISETVLASTITGGYDTHNIVILGGPCANKIAGDFLGDNFLGNDFTWQSPTLFSAICNAGVTPAQIGFGTDQGVIFMKKTGTKYQVLIAGYNAIDTRRSARSIVRYAETTPVDIKTAMTDKQSVLIQAVGAKGINDLDVLTWAAGP